MTHEDAQQLIEAIESLARYVAAIGGLLAAVCFGLGMIVRSVERIGAKGAE